jgi:hypothetical protein
MKEAMDALDQVIRQWVEASKEQTESVYYGA